MRSPLFGGRFVGEWSRMLAEFLRDGKLHPGKPQN